MKSEELEKRSRVLAFLAALIVIMLAGRLGYLQVVQGAYWEDVAQGQRLRLVVTSAPRGNILDREGNPLATNRPAFTAYLVYIGKQPSEETVRLLSEILNMSEDAIWKAADRLRPAVGYPYEPVPLKVDLTEEEHTRLEEYRDELPGVVVEVQPIRYYPGDTLAAHILGQLQQDEKGPSTRGTYGIEASYNGDPHNSGEGELRLQGKNGLRQIEVDAQGRPESILQEKPPVAGNNVVLTIDAGLQRVTEKALAERMEYLRSLDRKPCPEGCRAEYGAAVVLDVRTGEILALASVPSFDPNRFAERLHLLPGTPEYDAWQKEWQVLNDNPGKPLLNHATMNAAPPGSTFKPITAIAALETGVINPEERVVCEGLRIYDGHTFKDWTTHGRVNLEQAMGRSCNVYFYEMGARLSIDALAKTAMDFGLGGRTGLAERDGIGEIAGTVAGPEAKKHLSPGEPWFKSENLSAAIGQAQNETTPLQMALMTAAIANGGVRLRPYLVKSITDPAGGVLREFQPEVMGRVEVSEATLAEVSRAMLSVTVNNKGWAGVDSSRGTAYGVFHDFPDQAHSLLEREIEVAAKTGTAETGLEGEEPYGWFIGFAPFKEPEIAVSVMIRHGGGGSLAAAPVARAIMDAYFGLDRAKAGSLEPSIIPQIGEVINPL